MYQIEGSHRSLKIRLYKTLIVLSLLLINACDGSGNNNLSDGSSTIPTVVTCDFNQVISENTCKCPDHLFDKGGYCIDWAETVLKGAEYLRPGFPLIVTLDAGTSSLPYYAKLANIDKDEELELIYQPPNSPIWAWNIDGSLLSGWPVVATTFRHAKTVLAQLDDDSELELFSGHEGTAVTNDQCELNVFEFDGSVKKGWPKKCGLSVTTAPAAGDLNNDGYDEIVYFDGLNLNVVDRSGVIQIVEIQDLPLRLNEWCGISIADLDGNANKEILLLSCPFPDPSSVYHLRRLYVLDINLNVISGFPLEFRSGFDSQPVVGDVDGDGNKEIIVIGAGTIAQFQTQGILSSIKIISHQGIVENEINFTSWLGDGYFHFVTLADLNQDSTPEILVYDNDKIHAFNASGTELSGWPVDGGRYFAVGDIDDEIGVELITFKDNQPDNILDNESALAIYRGDGTLKDIEVKIDYMGNDPVNVMPIIGDLDLDGRNELIVIGNYWEGVSGIFPQVWAFNFGGENHGEIEWGQMFGNERNTGEYFGL